MRFDSHPRAAQCARAGRDINPLMLTSKKLGSPTAERCPVPVGRSTCRPSALPDSFPQDTQGKEYLLIPWTLQSPYSVVSYLTTSGRVLCSINHKQQLLG